MVLLVPDVADELFAIVFPLPVTEILAVGRVTVVKPLTTPPGLTQLEVVPVNAKFVTVPVLLPAKSLSVVTLVLVPDGIP